MNRYHSDVDNVMTRCRDVVAQPLTSVKDQSARPAAGPHSDCGQSMKARQLFV